jgi:GTPase SAR1 family protein
MSTETPPVAGSPAAAAAPSAPKKKPTVVLIVGMAGAGKTTMFHRLNYHCANNGLNSYYVNLDPAVLSLPFTPQIDIRDTVDYRAVMKDYKLGPNGAILTSLNLFATRFDQVLALLEQERDPPLDYVFVDTPGQIEVFTWSASGAIITEALAASFPTCVMFVVDTPRVASPPTFMSNMLYSCSIMYKTQLPLLLAFNKADVAIADIPLGWLKDFEALQEAMDARHDCHSYLGSLNRSMALALEEFYSTLSAVPISAVTGDGIPQLFVALKEATAEYEREYAPELAERIKVLGARADARGEKSMARLSADLESAKLESAK